MTPQFPTEPTHSLRCLGVGEGKACGRRHSSSFLYQFGPTQLLLDCGDGMSRALVQAGVGPDDIDALLLSHMHSDHVGGFSMLIQTLWLHQRRRRLPIHAPARAIPALKAWMHATILHEDLIGFELDWVPLEAGTSFAVGTVKVLPSRSSHLESLQRGFGASLPHTAFEAFSFQLWDGERRVAHTADIGRADEAGRLLEPHADLLVTELSHVELPELGAAIRGNPPGKTVFVHVASEWFNGEPSLDSRIRHHLDAVPFLVAADRDTIAF
jgi:hypothetical protein